MKTGQTIDQIIATVRSHAARERDFIAPQAALRFEPHHGTNTLAVNLQGETFKSNDVFLGQAHESAGIPKKYFDKCMATEPDLAAYNLNRWFSRSTENRLVRTFASEDPDRTLGSARALLSPSYDRTWGHAPMLAALQLALEDLKGVEFVSCEITDRKLYIKGIFPWLTVDFKSTKIGDAVTAGFALGNSETGHGLGDLSLFINIKMCNNGMVYPNFGVSKVHRGKKETQTGELQVSYANDTLLARRAALVGELRDTLQQMCTMDTLHKVRALIEGVSSVELANPIGAVQALASSYELTVEETKTVETEFLRGGDITRWGLVQALTAASSKVESYDRASELEALGGRLINLPQSSWQQLDVAA